MTEGDGDTLGELAAGLGAADVVAVIVALGLDALPADVVVPLLLPQAAVRTSRATDAPRYPPKLRLAFCLLTRGRIRGSEPESGAPKVVTIDKSIATQNTRLMIRQIHAIIPASRRHAFKRRSALLEC